MSLEYESEGRELRLQPLGLLNVLILALFCVFTLRLWYLQVHKGEYFIEKAQANRLRSEPVYAPRGLIRDRDGVILAVNEPAYALGLVREDVKDLEGTLRVVSEWTNIPYENLREVVTRQRKRVKPFHPIILTTNLSLEQFSRAEAGMVRWPGVEIIVHQKRSYPQGELLAHVLGYVAEANEDELEADPSLALGDEVGKNGIEQTMEMRLRGVKGTRQIEVDAAGRYLSETETEMPHAGNTLNLSIDLDLQETATRALLENGPVGAVVAMEATTGQILAMASLPSFDNNLFAIGLTPDQWETLRSDPTHPLQNRVYQSVYPPGSVFKLVVAGAGLHEGLIDPARTVSCSGSVKLGSHVFRCWRKQGHGSLDLLNALVQSCDSYFYEQGQRIGVDRIERFARASGLGQVTGIDLPRERPGLVPSREWKLKARGERWQGGENLNLAIGQGYTQLSPLQVARFVAALVNGGRLLKPTLLADEAPTVQGEIPLEEKNRKLLLESMRQTVENDRGTAKRLRTADVVMGGKTGTAQVKALKEEMRGKKTEAYAYEDRDHAWIASWGVKDGKAVVIVCMVEHGGHGGETAIPVVKPLYDQIFAEANATTPAVRWPEQAQAVTIAVPPSDPRPDKAGKRVGG